MTVNEHDQFLSGYELPIDSPLEATSYGLRSNRRVVLSRRIA